MESLELIKNIDENVKSSIKEVETLKAEIAKQNEQLTKLQAEDAKKGITIEGLMDNVREMQAKAGQVQELQQMQLNIDEHLQKAIEDIGPDKFDEAKNKKFEDYQFKHDSRVDRKKVVGTIVNANLANGPYVSYLDWRPGMDPEINLPGIRDVLPIIRSAGDTVLFPRELSTGEGSFGQQVTEGAAKPQVDYDLQLITVNLLPMAGWAAISRQALRNIPFIQDYLPSRLLRSLRIAEDLKFGSELYASATGVTTSTGFTGNPEIIVAYIRNLMKRYWAATTVLVSPDVWAKMLVHRPGTDNPYSLPMGMVVSVTGMVQITNGTRMISVVPVSFLTGGQVLLGDFTEAAMIESEGLTLRQSDSHSDYFVKNLIVFLLERVEALAVFRPDAFVAAELSLA